MSLKWIKSDSSEQRTMDCYRSLNILAHAQLDEIDIGSLCGGQGICKGDRVQTRPEQRSLFSPPTAAELKYFSEDEIKKGWRLACQCWPTSDESEDQPEMEIFHSFPSQRL